MKSPNISSAAKPAPAAAMNIRYCRSKMTNPVRQNSINKLWFENEDSQQQLACYSRQLVQRKRFHNPRATPTSMRWSALFIASLVTLSMAGYQADAQTRIVGPSDSVLVVISDFDLNGNPQGIDRYEGSEFVVFRTSRDEVGEAHPEIVETGASTGLFEFKIQLETDERACRLDLLGDPRFAAKGGSDPSVGVCPGDVLLVQYEDNRGADGRSALVDYVFEVKSWNPEFTADRISYAAGDRIAVDIHDPDANRDPDVADSLNDVRVFSDSDPAGRQFSAIETERNTGIFRLTFLTSLQNQNSAIQVKSSDEVTVQYVDDFPDDFSAFQEEKRFNYVIALSATAEEGVLTTSAPLVRTEEFISSGALFVGQQVTLTTEVTSSSERDEVPFVAIMEIRDAAGVTVSIGWQSGTVQPQTGAEIGMSWVPEGPGNYELRTFLISDMLNPVILSSVSSSEVTVT
jgi:hypothetical protein